MKTLLKSIFFSLKMGLTFPIKSSAFIKKVVFKFQSSLKTLMHTPGTPPL